MHMVDNQLYLNMYDWIKLPVDGMQVGAADRTSADPDQQFVRGWITPISPRQDFGSPATAA
jgi:hypothetical protein